MFKPNRYKINQNKLTFLPKVFAFFALLSIMFVISWYFRPFNSGEVKVLAINRIVKPIQNGKFFGNLAFYEEPEIDNKLISTPNPEITVKSFDSRLIDSKIFYLSQNCVDLGRQNCEFWSFDRTKNELIKLDSDIAKNIQNKDKNNLKFAETQDPNWFNFIIRAEITNEKSSSFQLFQLDKKNLQNTKTQIITRDNPDYATYFR